MDPSQNTPNIALTELSTTIKNVANRTTEPPGKTVLYRLTESIGKKIGEHDPQFNPDRWFEQCGVANFKTSVAA